MGKFIYSTPNRAPVPANPAEGGMKRAAERVFLCLRLKKQPDAA